MFSLLMKKFFLFLLLLLPLAMRAQNAADLHKAVVLITTFDAQGKVLHTTHGYFAQPEG